MLAWGVSQKSHKVLLLARVRTMHRHVPASLYHFKNGEIDEVCQLKLVRIAPSGLHSLTSIKAALQNTLSWE